jgi:DNA/RNA-binding domain of Phe-tRNA-synthetase-like protein
METVRGIPDIKVGEELRECCPELRLGLVACRVSNSDHDANLWQRITMASEDLRRSTALDEVKLHPAIAATRAAYKRCGKDPNRYRPSAEALRRRIVKGRDLYKVSTLVDVVNLVSLETGYSIGAFDADRIVGSLRWGIGRAGEPYEGIGRGQLNIEGLPVLRDREGGIGTPTSDAVRTRVDPDTTSFLMSINACAGTDGLQEAVDRAVDLLSTYVAAGHMETAIL